MMMFYFYVAYMALMNLVCFFMMMADKRFAIMHVRRIPERVLFGFAAAGGAVGGFFGMRIFRHKTRHLLFSVGLPLAIVMHALIAYLLLHYGII